jgi:hypothetical protein
LKQECFEAVLGDYRPSGRLETILFGVWTKRGAVGEGSKATSDAQEMLSTFGSL